MYHAGRENASGDALSRHPQEPAPLRGIAQDETQVAAVSSATDIATLLQEDPVLSGKDRLSTMEPSNKRTEALRR